MIPIKKGETMKKKMEMEILRYELAKDGMGLLVYFRDENGEIDYYHQHSNEFTPEQKIIRNSLVRAIADTKG